MFYSQMPLGLDVCFCEGNQQIGKRLRFADTDRICDLLKAAHYPVEDLPAS
jgi:hypothetical protein